MLEPEIPSLELAPPPYSETPEEPLVKGPASLSRSPSSGTMSSVSSTASDDMLPSYTAAVTMRGELKIKKELATPFRKPLRRQWRLAEVEIDNTQLKIKTIVGGVFSQCHLYTLQFAEVGLASDYIKKEHMLRLRVEACQYLIECSSREEMMSWFQALQMAICLALPLELRTLPEESKRRRNKIRERERREQRRLRRAEQEALSAAQDNAQDGAHDEDEPENAHEPRAQRGQRKKNRSERRRQADVKWNPRTRRSRFSEKDYPHLAVNAPWDGKDVLYRGRWALISNKEIVFMVTQAA